MENLSLVFLQLVLADAAAAIENVDQPDSESVENEEIGEEGRHVAVPDVGEGGVETNSVDRKEVGDVCRNNGQKGYITRWLESKNICVDQDGDENGVEAEKDREEEGFHV